MKIKILVTLSVLLLGFFLRFYKLDVIPNGIDSDEASQGYDAFSILKTGKDRYGETFPIFLRSFGNYQSPLYTYLTIIPISIFDLSVLATRLVSAISGIVILICTFFLILNFKHAKRFDIAIITTLFMAISPWAVLFSRTAVEANLALALLVFSILLLVLSLDKHRWLFLIGCIFLSLSTHAYHAERIISTVFLGLFIYFFKKEIFKKKKILVLGITAFFIIQLPQLVLINSPAYKSRLDQVEYWKDEYNNSHFKNIPFGQSLSVIRKFSAQYTAYFSPKNLFFDADEQGIRSMPDLSIFYSWMIIPFIFGIKVFLKERSNQVIKILCLILLISPIPAAVTREPFYTIRVLPVFWVMTIMIGFGAYFILEKLQLYYLRYVLVIISVLFSIVLLYNSYFILLKYERMDGFGYYNIQLIKKLEEFKENKIILDSARRNLGIWYFFIKKYDPEKLQKELKHYVQKGYYSSTEFDEKYKIDNMEIVPIDFSTGICKGNIIVGDSLSISEAQATDHKLKLLFEIKDLNNITKFKGYSTDPNAKC